MTTTLLTAWSYAGAGDQRHALDTLDHIHEPSLAVFRDYHAGLIADLLGNGFEAQRRLKAAYEADKNTLRLVDVYARFLVAPRPDPTRRRQVFADFSKLIPNHPLIVERARRHRRRQAAGAGDPQRPRRRGGSALRPRRRRHDPGRRTGGADLSAPGAVSSSPTTISRRSPSPTCSRTSSATTRRSTPTSWCPPARRCARAPRSRRRSSSTRSAATTTRRRRCATSSPPIPTTPTRGARSAACSARPRTTTTPRIPTTRRSRWSARPTAAIGRCSISAASASSGRSNGRRRKPTSRRRWNSIPTSRWCSIISAIRGSTRASISTRRSRCCAARSICRPNDGYIVDSLGWAHYKLGHYQEATDALEKAIDLKPADPVVNDHLGDAYWRVDRRIEAHFQWNHARDMKPDPEDLPKILDKIDSRPARQPERGDAGRPAGARRAR